MTATSQNSELKTAISVKDMAALCGLSRQRFGQLVKAGVFPAPLYDVATRRPFYSEEMQHVCLEVRRRNFGINQQVVMFYARRAGPALTKTKANGEQHPEILDGLKALGLNVTATQVAEAMKALFPNGSASAEHAEVIRAVFIHLRRKNGSVSVGSN